MSLARRQAQAINQIIQEEVQNALKGRRLREEHLQRADLVEYGPGRMEDRVDVGVLEREIETTIGDAMFDLFDDEIYKMTQKMHRRFVQELFKATQRFGMGWTSPAEVGSLLAGGENEDVSDAEMEFFHDVQAAINDYGKKLAKSLIKVARPEGEED
jgi:hypothetical protein